MFTPQFRITPVTATALMTIEVSRHAIEALPITASLLAALRETARLHATHYSTQIEGNRLTLAHVQAVLQGEQVPGRVRDSREVRSYYQALEAVERLAQQRGPLTEAQLQRLHGLGMTGRQRPTCLSRKPVSVERYGGHDHP